MTIDWSTPLHQQNIDKNKLQSILKKKLALEVKTTSTNSGFLLYCPKCLTSNKLFYSFEGKQFLCLNYRGCGFRAFSLVQLRQEIKKKLCLETRKSKRF